MDDEETLYARLGGEEGISAVVDAFYERVLSDEQVNHLFEGVEMDTLRAHQTRFLSATTGGPVEYTGDSMEAAHRRLNVTREQFEIVAAHLEETLAAFDVPRDDIDAVMTAVATFEDDIVSA